MQADAKTCRDGDRGRRGGRSCRRTRRRREAASRRCPAGRTARRSSRRWRSRRRLRRAKGRAALAPSIGVGAGGGQPPDERRCARTGREARATEAQRTGVDGGGIERERRCAVRLGQVRSPGVRHADEESGRPHAVALERGHPMERDARHDRGCGTKGCLTRHVDTEASSRRAPTSAGAGGAEIPRSRAALVASGWSIGGVAVGGDAGVVPASGGADPPPAVSAPPAPVADLRFSVGSRVTAIISAMASAASAQDRATIRRGAGSMPAAVRTSSATTFPARADVSATLAEIAASSTNWMRGERAATRAASSLREMQSGAPRNSRRALVAWGAAPAGSIGLWKRSATSRAPLEVIAPMVTSAAWLRRRASGASSGSWWPLPPWPPATARRSTSGTGGTAAPAPTRR